MRQGMNNSRELKVGHNTSHMIYIVEYLYVLPGEREGDKIDETELNDILVKIMTIVLSKQAYVQGFDWETIILKKL